MISKRGGLIAVFFLLLLCVTQLQAAVFHQADLDWYSLESEHFQIHFHNGLESDARQLLAVAERVHKRLSDFMRWEPLGRTEIVLTDEYDVSNGYATPYPANRMTLYLSAPDDINSLEDYGDWLELVFTHEYLHILHLDKANGAPNELRNIFGRFLWLFPNAFQPAWFTEGLATYVETDVSRGVGRGQSSYFDMLMRMEYLSGLKPLRQVNQPMASWPMGTVPYLYGVYFYQFIAERYGEETIHRLVENYSDNFIPFRINSNTGQILGKKLDQLWYEFDVYLKERYQPQKEQVLDQGEIVGERLTHQGYFTGPLAAGKDGSIYYIAFDAVRHPALMRLVPGGRPKRLADVELKSRLALKEEGEILLAQPEVCENAAYYYDLYHYDSDGGSKKRLTHCGRYRMADWLPEGKGIIAVHNSGGQNALHRLDANGERVAVLWQGTQGEVISHIDVSPDGNQVVASLWRAGQGWDLALFELATGKWSALTQTEAIENHPRFSDDGKSILFSADYDGIYNIHRLLLDSGRTERITNVIGGAFYPLLSADGSDLTYVGYTAEGFDLYQLSLANNPVHTVKSERGSGALSPPSSPPVATGKVSDYSSFSSLRPRWWFPTLFVDDERFEIGFFTGGSDTLMRHNYALQYGYDVFNNRSSGSLDYIYDRFTPILKLHASNYYEDLRNSDSELLKVRGKSSYQAEVVFPLLRNTRRWSAHLGVGEESETDVRIKRSGWEEPDVRDRIAGIALAFSSAVEFPRGISRVDGREVMLAGEDSDVLEGSDYTGRAYTLDWKEFVRLGGEHVLGMRLVGAQGDSGIRPFNLGGTSQIKPLPQLLDSTAPYFPFSRRSYALRGYDEGLPQLTGNHMRLASFEYRFPVWRLERGAMAPPIGLHQLHGTLFMDNGAAWYDGQKADDYYTGVGVELKADVVVFYSAMARVSLGFARGLDDIGEHQVYLRIGGAF